MKNLQSLLRVACLDPGGTTGLVTASLHESPTQVLLQVHKLLSLTDKDEAVYQTIHSGAECVIMEKRAPLSDSVAGVEAYEYIYNNLVRQGYRHNTHTFFQSNGLSTISPGRWKPVMQAQGITELGSIPPQTPHERDCLLLLYYVTKINHMTKEIEFL